MARKMQRVCGLATGSASVLAQLKRCNDQTPQLLIAPLQKQHSSHHTRNKWFSIRSTTPHSRVYDLFSPVNLHIHSLNHRTPEPSNQRKTLFAKTKNQTKKQDRPFPKTPLTTSSDNSSSPSLSLLGTFPRRHPSGSSSGAFSSRT